MTKCPCCGANLKVSLAVGTDYQAARRILDQKPSGADLTNEQLNALAWKQSQKKAALSTLLVNSDLLSMPLAKLLRDRLTTAVCQSWKLGEVTYKLSSNHEGTATWIQRWKPVAGDA